MQYDLGLLPFHPNEPRGRKGRPPEDRVGRLVVEHVAGRRDVILHPHPDLLAIVRHLALPEQGQVRLSAATAVTAAEVEIVA